MPRTLAEAIARGPPRQQVKFHPDDTDILISSDPDTSTSISKPAWEGSVSSWSSPSPLQSPSPVTSRLKASSRISRSGGKMKVYSVANEVEGPSEKTAKLEGEAKEYDRDSDGHSYFHP